MLVARILRSLPLSAGLLLGISGPARAQAALSPPVPLAAPRPEPPPPPKLLLKAGMRLTHLFYLPGSGTWQLVLPTSIGAEYRFKPHFSWYAQAEVDISAGGRAPRGRRGATALPTPTTDVSAGLRYYFNEATSADPWGNYLALEGSTELAQLAVRGRGRRARPTARLTPGAFVFCGTQHQGPGRRLFYDLNAGLGVQIPSPYAADAAVRPPWDVAAQVNLRVHVRYASRRKPSGW